MRFEHTEVFNFESAFRGLRNPMNSHGKADSSYCVPRVDMDCDACPLKGEACNLSFNNQGSFIIGKNDMDLAQRMIKAGNPNDKFLRQIFVSVDITAPRYWWSEFDTYKIGTVADSESTMHTIHKKPFSITMFETNDIIQRDLVTKVIPILEQLRKQYNESNDFNYIIAIKSLLPESFLQKRTVTMDYEIIRNIIHQRYNHRIPLWRINTIDWCHTLPYANELLFYCNGDDKNE